MGLVVAARKTLHLEDLEPYINDPRRTKNFNRRTDVRIHGKVKGVLNATELEAEHSARVKVGLGLGIGRSTQTTAR